MVIASLVLLYTGLLSAISGLFFFRAAGTFLSLEEEAIPFIPVSLAGVSLLTTVAGVLSLWIRIGLAAQAIIVALIIMYLVCDRKYVAAAFSRWIVTLKSTSGIALVFAAGGALYLLVYSVITPELYDTYYYHAPAIRWIEEYPAVPGLGNFHSRLAFNSSAFIANALFGFSFLKARPVHLVNSYVFLLFLLWVSSVVNDLRRRAFSETAFVTAGFLLAAVCFSIRSISSPTPDIMTTYLCWTLFGLAFHRLSEANVKLDRSLLCIAFCASFLVTVKLSSLPIMILPLAFAGTIFLSGRRLQAMQLLFLTALPAVPFVARNIVLSGYVVYPFPAIDVFTVDWKVPFHRVMVEKDIIHRLARGPSSNFLEPPVPFSEWLLPWMKDRLSLFDKSLFLLILLALVCYVVMFLASRPALSAMIGKYRRYLALYGTAAGGVLFWFVTAPDVRFGYGFIVPLCVLLLLPLVFPFARSQMLLLTRRPVAVRIAAVILLILVLIEPISHSLKTLSSIAANSLLITPAGYARTEVREVVGHGFSYYIPLEEDYIGYAPLPTALDVDTDIELRDSALHSGFRYTGKMHRYPPPPPGSF